MDRWQVEYSEFGQPLARHIHTEGTAPAYVTKDGLSRWRARCPTCKEERFLHEPPARGLAWDIRNQGSGSPNIEELEREEEERYRKIDGVLDDLAADTSEDGSER